MLQRTFSKLNDQICCLTHHRIITLSIVSMALNKRGDGANALLSQVIVCRFPSSFPDLFFQEEPSARPRIAPGQSRGRGSRKGRSRSRKEEAGVGHKRAGSRRRQRQQSQGGGGKERQKDRSAVDRAAGSAGDGEKKQGRGTGPGDGRRTPIRRLCR